MRYVFIVGIDDFSTTIGYLLDLIDQMLVDLKEEIGVGRDLSKQNYLFEELLSVIQEEFLPQFFGQVVVD